MSNWREQLEQEETKATVDWLTEYYHYPVFVFLAVFAFWNRVRNYSEYIVDGQILYGGNDPWYHMRSTEYAVENFPETMPFDPWTNFPEGTFSAQFGTMFDQLIALVALIVGLGDPDPYTIRLLLLISPAVFGMLVCIPAYYIGRRLGDRFGGLVAVAFVAFAPDRFLQVSLAGSADHHVIETLMMGLSVVGVMVALRVAQKEKPVFELVRAREYDAIRGTIGWSMLAGVAIGIYIWIWPPAVWVYGILGVFFLVHLSAQHVRGKSPEHPAFVGVISLGTAGIMQLAAVRGLELSATSRSLLQPGLGLGAVVGLVVLAWLSREVSSRDIPRLAYPGGVATTVIVGLGLMWLLTPGTFEFFVNQIDRVFGFITPGSTAAGTIGEAQSGDLDALGEFYQFALYTGFLGAAVLLARYILDTDPEGQDLLVLIWAGFMIAASLTQVRFSYYLVLVVGGLNATLVGVIFSLMETPDEKEDIVPETYQILVVLVIILALFVPMLGLPFLGDGGTATGVSNNASDPGDVVGWNDSLDWMSKNTPEPGQYGNPDGEAMEYYGQYEKTDDFEYPEGAYGVLSWWDYGHWITALGERIPNANPFQQNAGEAADFFLAQNESAGEEVLESELDDEKAQTRYVMIDALMVETETQVRGKFFAPADFHDQFDRADFYTHIFDGDGNKLAIGHKQAYYQTMMNRLYQYHGSAQEPEPMILDYSNQEQRFDDGPLENAAFVSGAGQGGDPLVSFANSTSQAREQVANDPTKQIGGIGPYPEERVEALDHFRLVYMDEVPAVQATGGNNDAYDEATNQHGMNNGINARALGRTLNQLQQAPNAPYSDGPTGAINYLYPNTPAFTKTFERVPGATIEGSLPEPIENETVTLQAPMNPENGKNFTYTKQVQTDENGEFTTTVPYSTTGYDEWGVDEGYTNVSVRAEGPYELSTQFRQDADGNFTGYQGTVNVTEGQVIGEDDSPATVELNENSFSPGDLVGGGDGEDGEDGSDGTDGEDGTDGTDGEDGTESTESGVQSGETDVPDIAVNPTQ